MYYLPDCAGQGRFRWPFLACLLVLLCDARAMEPLDDSEMSDVAGRDGLSVSLNSGGTVTADGMVLSNDGAASAVLEDLALQGLAGPLDIEVEVDAGSVGGQEAVRIQGSWTELMAYVNSWSLGAPLSSPADLNDPGWQSSKSASLGSVGIQTSGSFEISGPGLLDASSTDGFLDISSQGGLYYRQGAKGRPELSFQNFSLGASFTDGAGNPGTGTVGIDSEGLLIAADHMDIDLFFDLYYAANPDPDGTGNGYFDPDAASPAILFGWEGGVENASLRLGSGGIGTGNYVSGPYSYIDYDGTQTGSRTEGIHFTSSWDYSDAFAWRLGQASEDVEVEVRFTDWQRLGGAGSTESHDFHLPLILDTVTSTQNPGGICFGGNMPASGSLSAASCGTVGGTMESIAIPAGSTAFSATMRDGGLHAYNTTVEVIEDATTDSFNWSLLYTFGKLDANIHLYPEQRGGNPSLKSDVVLAIQSPGYWEAAQVNFDPGNPDIDPNAASRWASNTHFMIADTATNLDGGPTNDDQFGIGMLNADLLWKVEDLFLRVVGDGEIAGMPGGLALESQSGAQYRFRGLFGGGDLTDLSDPVRIALLDVNLDTDRFIFVLGPAPDTTEEYLAFDGLLDFSGNAYLSLAEPSTPSASFRLGSVGGRVRWQDGRVQLESSQSTGDVPRLTIANDILFGSTAGGDPLIGTVSFGGENLGRIAIPSGHFYSSISLKPQ